MSPIKVMIVDDEALARAELRRLLSLFPEVEICSEAADAVAAMACLDEQGVDLVFLDIDMPEVNGLELAGKLTGLPCRVVFCTAFDQYALQAFGLDALDYLTKPVSSARLRQCLNKVRQTMDSADSPVTPKLPLAMDSPLMLKDGDQVALTTPGQLELLESVGNYVRVRGTGVDMLVTQTLMNLEQRLPAGYFMRANRQTIVNLQKVTAIALSVGGGYSLTLASGTELTVSRRQGQLMKQQMAL